MVSFTCTDICGAVIAACVENCCGSCCERTSDRAPLIQTRGGSSQPSQPASSAGSAAQAAPSCGSRLWGRVTERWNGWTRGQRATIVVATSSLVGGTILSSMQSIREGMGGVGQGINTGFNGFVNGIEVIGLPIASVVEKTVHWIGGAAMTVGENFVTAGDWVKDNPGTTVSILAGTAIVCACCCWPRKTEAAVAGRVDGAPSDNRREAPSAPALSELEAVVVSHRPGADDGVGVGGNGIHQQSADREAAPPAPPAPPEAAVPSGAALRLATPAAAGSSAPVPAVAGLVDQEDGVSERGTSSEEEGDSSGSETTPRGTVGILATSSQLALNAGRALLRSFRRPIADS